MPTNFLGVLLALTSAFVWGAGDFSGGYASRKHSSFFVLAVSALSGLLILIVAALLLHESFPSPRGMLMAALAGVTGGVGIAAFYHALSLGHAASVAPATGVISAALPVLFSALTAGLPGWGQLIGFGLALAGIWLVSAASAPEGRLSRQELLLIVGSGTAFGAFFIFLAQIDSGKIFTPLIVTRSVTFFVGLLLTLNSRQPIPSPLSNPAALLSGVLDAGGNIFYILAKEYARLDTVAVLASLYPASTVLLAGVLLKEHLSVSQRFGILLCLGAIALITL